MKRVREFSTPEIVGSLQKLLEDVYAWASLNFRFTYIAYPSISILTILNQTWVIPTDCLEYHFFLRESSGNKFSRSLSCQRDGISLRDISQGCLNMPGGDFSLLSRCDIFAINVEKKLLIFCIRDGGCGGTYYWVSIFSMFVVSTFIYLFRCRSEASLAASLNLFL